MTQKARYAHSPGQVMERKLLHFKRTENSLQLGVQEAVPPQLLCLGIQPILFLGCFASSLTAPRCFLPACPFSQRSREQHAGFHLQLASSLRFSVLFPWLQCFCWPMVYVPFKISFTFLASILPSPGQANSHSSHTHRCAIRQPHIHTWAHLRGNLHTCRSIGILLQDNGLCKNPSFFVPVIFFHLLIHHVNVHFYLYVLT